MSRPCSLSWFSTRAARRRVALAITSFALLAVTTPAHADEYPVCGHTPSTEDVNAAKGMHAAAEQYYAKGQYDRAIASWTDAYNFDCTAHRLLINIGNAHEKLGNADQAIHAFEVYIDRAGPNADRDVVAKVENLRKSKAAPPTPDPLPPPPPPDPGGPDDGNSDGAGAGPWVLVGVGVAAVVVGAVIYSMGLTKEDDGDALCGGVRKECNNEEGVNLANEGIDFQIGGGITLVVGSAAVVGGLLWFLLAETLPPTANAFRVDVLPSPTGLGVNASVRF